MSSSNNRDPRLDASDLFAILDNLAGITDLDRKPISEEELDGCEPIPLPRELTERSLEKIRAMKAEEVAATRRSWWKRPAAALPIAISVLLLAAAPMYFFVWSGRNSTKELTFEHAIETVFNSAVPMNRRYAAYGSISIRIQVGISTVKDCALRNPDLRPDAEEAFRVIRQMCDDPASMPSITPTPSGHLERLLAAVRQDDDTETITPKLTAIRDFVRSATFGIDAFSRGAELGPRFRQTFAIQMPRIRKRLQW